MRRIEGRELDVRGVRIEELFCVVAMKLNFFIRCFVECFICRRPIINIVSQIVRPTSVVSWNVLSAVSSVSINCFIKMFYQLFNLIFLHYLINYLINCFTKCINRLFNQIFHRIAFVFSWRDRFLSCSRIDVALWSMDFCRSSHASRCLGEWWQPSESIAQKLTNDSKQVGRWWYTNAKTKTAWNKSQQMLCT